MATRCRLILLLASVVLCDGFHAISTGMGMLRRADRAGMRIVAPARQNRVGKSKLLSIKCTASGDGVLIVGGGPSGLGAALEIDTIMNAELNAEWGGGAKITVVEKMQPVSSYDPNKGFMYLVSALGLQFCDRHGLSESLATEGVDGSTLNGNRIGIDGSRSKFSFRSLLTCNKSRLTYDTHVGRRSGGRLQALL